MLRRAGPLKSDPAKARAWQQRSKPLASGKALERTTTPARSRTPVRPVSAKRAAESEQRRLVREATFARDGYRCVASGFVPGLPCLPGLECDEMQGRGREPGSHLDVAATQSLCPVDHLLKGSYPRIAGLLGLYGLAEQERRLAEEAPGALLEALAEWARRKGQAMGAGGGHGGDPVAVLALAARRRTGA